MRVRGNVSPNSVSVENHVILSGYAEVRLCGTISSSEFLSVFTLIVGFYFGVQHEKKNSESKGE